MQGFCECGCGARTTISPVTHRRYGWVKGQPRRFILGHKPMRPLVIETGPTFKIDGVYCRLIPLTKGFHAIVDDADYPELMKHHWNVRKSAHGTNHYAMRRGPVINGKQSSIAMHREILGLSPGDKRQVDHAYPLCTLDNRRNNLRFATGQQNQHNRGKYRTNSSGYKGVYWNKRKARWVAQISTAGKRVGLGYFLTAEEAYAAYCSAAEHYHKEFARVA